MRPDFDVVVVGGGPAGSVCATVCARSGHKVLLIEREEFPRDKVCGDCLNPSAWAILERLGMVEKIKTIPHSAFDRVDIVTLGGKVFSFDLPESSHGEIGIRRRDLDQALLENASHEGVEILDGTPVVSVVPRWEIRAGKKAYTCENLVAADGRNSTVARLLNLLPPPQKDRAGLQAHLPLQPHQRRSVEMRLHPEGYSGGASIGEELWNLCLVARGEKIDQLKSRASRLWELPKNLRWRSVTPLSRIALRPAENHLFLVGDAARVVEPFTGEGIYYALASGELAGTNIRNPGGYCRAHAALYTGRIWINQLAKQAVLHPSATSWMLENLPAGRLLRQLTTKVTQSF